MDASDQAESDGRAVDCTLCAVGHCECNDRQCHPIVSRVVCSETLHCGCGHRGPGKLCRKAPHVRCPGGIRHCSRAFYSGHCVYVDDEGITMRIINFAASQAISSSAVLIFLTLLLLAAARRMSNCISLFAAQSAVIPAQVFATAYLHKSLTAFVVFVMVLLIKVLALPYAFFQLVKRLHPSRDGKASIAPAGSVFITAALIFVSYSAVQSYAKDLNVARDPLAAAVAIILSGCFLMTSRNKALMQILGLLILGNGIFMSALSTTIGIPLGARDSSLFALVMAVFLMGIFMFA